jgi:hypothetical protein
VNEWISKLPARTREYILEISRQRDEWQAKYEGLTERITHNKGRLRHIYEHWLEHSGSNPDRMEFKQRIEPLLKMYTDGQITHAINRYLEDTEPKYLSLRRFCEIIPQYVKRQKKIALDPNSDLSIEQQKEFTK